MVHVNIRKPDPSWADPQYLSTDIVLFTIEERRIHVLLLRREREPFKGQWALPGGFVHTDESLDDAALRLLHQKLGIKDVHIEQLFTFGDKRRGPQLRVVTTAYLAVARLSDVRAGVLGEDSSYALFPIEDLPRLAFDHNKIFQTALDRLRHKANYTTICSRFLERHFSLSDLQEMYEVILGQRLDKRNFRKKMLQLGILKALQETRQEPAGRPARLYAFSRPGVVTLQERGILVPF